VALALDTRLPDTDRGRLGLGLALAILASVAVLLAVDLWAFLSWRRMSLLDTRDRLRARRAALVARRGAAVAEPEADRQDQWAVVPSRP
jgi:hypothetical protein